MTQEDFADFLAIKEAHRQEQRCVRRKRIRQALRKLAYIMAAVGWVVVLGAAGRSDMADMVGEYYPFSAVYKWMAVGVTLMMPAVIVKVRDRE